MAAEDCLKTYTDTATGTKASRPEWNKCLADLRPGDTLIIWKIDRLGRNLRDLVEIVTTLEARGVGTGGDRGPHVGELPAAGYRGGQDGHTRLRAARVAGTVPSSGAGDLLELSAEGSASAEAGHPRDAGVVELSRGRPQIRTHGADFSVLQLGRELREQGVPYLGPVRVLDGRPGFAQRR
ncbi:MAG: recombinase family protein [Streptosporangiaceae bacterium]